MKFKLLLTNLFLLSYAFAETPLKAKPPNLNLELIVFLQSIGPDWFVVIITGILAFYTWKLWKATSETVQDNKELSINQLRAYIGVEKGSWWGWQNKEKIRVMYDFINYGQTVATHVNIIGSVHLLPYPLPCNYSFEKYICEQNLEAIIFPNNDPVSGGFETIYEITEEDKKNIISNSPTKTLYVYGKIQYLDIFKIKRETQFGYFLNPISIKKENNVPIYDEHKSIQFKWSSIIGENRIS